MMNVQRLMSNDARRRGAGGGGFRFVPAVVALGAALASSSASAAAVEMPTLAAPALRSVGIVELALVALFAAAVFYVANWTFFDVRCVRTNEQLWSTVVLGGALAGLAAALAVPWFALGLALGVILFGGAAMAYVVNRNALVVPGLTVVSGAHLARLRRRLGGRGAEREDRGPVAAEGREILFMGLDDLPMRVPAETRAEQEAAKEVERIFFDAIVQHASVVGLLVRPQKVQVRLRVEGKVVEGGDVDGLLAPLVSAAIKRLAGLDPAETRKPQEARLRAVVASQAFELRLKTQGSVKGEQLAARIIDLVASRMTLQDLGLSEPQIAMLSEALAKRPGIVLVSAPKNSGLSTTLHACLRHFDRYMNTVVAFEPHVDLEVENVQHVVLCKRTKRRRRPWCARCSSRGRTWWRWIRFRRPRWRGRWRSRPVSGRSWCACVRPTPARRCAPGGAFWFRGAGRRPPSGGEPAAGARLVSGVQGSLSAEPGVPAQGQPGDPGCGNALPAAENRRLRERQARPLPAVQQLAIRRPDRSV